METSGQEAGVKRWVGWIRHADGHAPWQSVCWSPTEAECWAKLIAYKPVVLPRCEKVVLPEGVKP